MSSMLGTALRVSIFGESHAPAIGCSIDGMPAGVPLDLDELQNFLDRLTAQFAKGQTAS